MKSKNLILIGAVLLCAVFTLTLHAQTSAFTYQGRLLESGTPANGIYNLMFTLYDSSNSPGTVVAGPITNSAVAVTNGLFTTTLDFGASVFDGSDRWLAIGVATNGSDVFTTLNARRRITSTPYAIQAANAATAASAVTVSGTVAASQLTGTISSNNIGAGSITSVMLASNSVGTAQLADAAVTADKVFTASEWLLHRSILNPTLQAGDQFGYAVAAVGADQVLVGAPYYFTGVATAGAAYLLNTNGTLLTTFTNPAPQSSSVFGYAVAAVGADAVLVGEPYYNTGAGEVGAAYLFSTNGTLLTTFTNPTPENGDDFGQVVATVGTDKVLISAPYDNTGASSAGTVYLFSTNGTLLNTFTNPTPQFNDSFGQAVAVVGADKVLVGTPYDNTGATQAGAAYLINTNGTLLTTFTNPAPQVGDYFGYAVAAVGPDKVLVGAPFNNTGTTNAGAAYLFSTDGTLLTTFTNPTPQTGDQFGYAVAAVGADQALVGAPFDNTGAKRAGAAYLFSTNGTLLNTFTNPTPQFNDGFGQAVAVVGADKVLVGTPNDNTSANGSGAVYEYQATGYAPGLIAAGVAPNAITSTEIANGAVGTAQLASGSTFDGTFTGDGSGLTNLNATNLTGTVGLSHLPTTVLVTNGASGVTISGTFTGDGSGLTGLNANNLTGSVPAASLTSVPATSLTGTVGLSHLPSVVVTNDETGVTLGGTFSGDGGGLTNLNVTNLTGTVSFEQLPSAVVTNNETGVTISGTFSGNGAGVTNVDLLQANTQGLINFTPNFVLASSPGVGSHPYSVVAADVNGDGHLDLISANENAQSLSVLTNDGSGGFVLASSPGVGNGPTSVTAADVNGDGHPDLICANSSGNALTVLTNDGSGGFVFASTLAVGSHPYSVVAADVNGDGHLDLISANEYAQSLSVLTNDGSGGFVLSSSPGVGNGPTSVTAADVNGDGHLDLICANSGDNTLTVLTNDGSGGFVLASTLTVGHLPVWVTAADVNGNGHLDLICANRQDQNLTVLTNDGSGGFVTASTLSVAGHPQSVVAADVNGDGYPDLISANGSANTLTVLINDGSGGFVRISSPGVGNQSQSVAAADVNGDGRPDVISANQNDNTLTVLFNFAMISGSFTGDGSGLTGLNAANLTGSVPAASLTSVPAGSLTGTVGLAQLPSAVVTNNETGVTLEGTFTGDGSGLTGTGDNLGDHTATTNINLNGHWLSGNGASQGVFVNTSGNVGIGTSSPEQKLHVVGTAQIQDGNLQFSTQSGSSLYHAVSKISAGLVGGPGIDPTNENLTFKVSNGTSGGTTNVLMLRGDGRVGIGTTDPAAALDVSVDESATNYGGIRIDNVNPTVSGERTVFLDLANNDPSSATTYRLQNVGNVTGRSGNFEIYQRGSVGSGARLVIRTNGDVGIGTTSPGHLLVVGNSGSPAYCDGTTWQNGSDRNSKKAFSGISPLAVLKKVAALPITEWQYKVDAADVRHMGPMAQDFHKAFHLDGKDNKHIATIDEEGVALAAIQGLNQKMETRDQRSEVRIQKLQAENAKLKRQLNELVGTVNKLSQEINRGAR